MRYFVFLFMIALYMSCFAEEGTAKTVTLEETVNATLKSHRTIKTIQENRAVLQAELKRAKAGYGPKMYAEGRMGIGALSNTTTRANHTDDGFNRGEGAGVNLVQPIFDGWANRSRVRTVSATLDSMTSRVFDNGTTYALDSIIAHIDVIRLRKIRSLAEKNVLRHEELLVLAREREQMGADTMADVTQAEGRLSRARSTLATSRADVQRAEATYTRLTGFAQTPPDLEIVPPLSPMYANMQDVLAKTEIHNPKLGAYVNDIKAARAENELNKAVHYPQLNLEAGADYSNRGGVKDEWTQNVDVMGVVRWNFFSSGADMYAVRAGAARVRQARQQLYNLVDELALQTRDTWTSYKEAIALTRNYTEAVTYNMQTRDAYFEQFNLAERRLLDVLDAESELFNSSIQKITASSNIVVGTYKMYALTGDLLVQLKINTDILYEVPEVIVPTLAIDPQ